MKSLSLLTAAMVLAGGAASQTVTVYETLPDGFKNAEGSFYNYTGWRYTSARSLTLIPGRNVASTIKVIRGLRVRPDGGRPTVMVARTVSVEIAMSDKGILTVGPPYYWNWQKYYGTNRTVVMAKKTIRYPAVATTTTPPHPWSKSINFPFDKSWIRTGATTDGICIDCKFYTTTAEVKSWEADATAYGSMGEGVIIGTGCPTRLHISYADGGFLGSQAGFFSYGYSRAAGDFAVAFLGTKQVKIPIPGFTGCYLWTIPALIHPQVKKTVSSSGYTGRYFWGKVKRSWVGAKVFSQIIAFTPTAKTKALSAYRSQIGGGSNLLFDQITLFGSSYFRKNFDPDKSPPNVGHPSVTIFGVY